jgi:hypothetical protein
MLRSHGLIVHEPAIFVASRGMSSVATSWWMDFKTSHPGAVAPLARVDGGHVYFVACDSIAEALRLRIIMLTAGKLPATAVRPRFSEQTIDSMASGYKSRRAPRQIHRQEPDR